MQSDRTKIWDSVVLQDRFFAFGAGFIKRANLLKLLSNHINDLVILSAHGYRKIVMFKDNGRATLKVTKDDEEEDEIDIALDVLVKVIKAEVGQIEYEKQSYKREMSKSTAAESVSGTLQLLLQRLSPSLDADSLTSLLIGNMVTSVICSYQTPLQIALGVLIHRKK